MLCRAQCLQYLGSHFRTVLGLPKSMPSAEVAHQLLSEYVFIHLDQRRPADKLALLMQMLHKLYALVRAWVWGLFGGRLCMHARMAHVLYTHVGMCARPPASSCLSYMCICARLCACMRARMQACVHAF